MPPRERSEDRARDPALTAVHREHVRRQVGPVRGATGRPRSRGVADTRGSVGRRYGIIIQPKPLAPASGWGGRGVLRAPGPRSDRGPTGWPAGGLPARAWTLGNRSSRGAPCGAPVSDGEPLAEPADSDASRHEVEHRPGSCVVSRDMWSPDFAADLGRRQADASRARCLLMAVIHSSPMLACNHGAGRRGFDSPTRI